MSFFKNRIIKLAVTKVQKAIELKNPKDPASGVKWISGEGKIRLIKKMGNEHLRNTINYIKRQVKRNDHTNLDFMLSMAWEAGRRGINFKDFTNPETKKQRLVGYFTKAQTNTVVNINKPHAPAPRYNSFYGVSDDNARGMSIYDKDEDPGDYPDFDEWGMGNPSEFGDH